MAARAFLIDAESVSKKGKASIRLFLKSEKTGKAFAAYCHFQPYFFLLPDESKAGAFNSPTFAQFKNSLLETPFHSHGEEAKIIRVEEEDKLFFLKPIRLLKIYCSHPGHVPAISDALREFGKRFEDSIPFHLRYLIDKKITPNSLVELELGGVPRHRLVESITPLESHVDAPLRVLSFDIETYNPSGAPNASKDPCMMISFADGTGAKVFSYKHSSGLPFVKFFSSEKEMLEAFASLVQEKHADVLCSYNGDSFDLPYLLERAKRTGARFFLSRDKKPYFVKRLGPRNKIRFCGRVNFDVFPAVSFLNTVGAIRLPRLTLEDVYLELLGKEKIDVTTSEMWGAWETGTGLGKIFEYSASDAKATFELANYVLPMQIELSKLVGMHMSDSSRSSTGQLVEFFLMKKSFESGELIPNKPGYSEVQARLSNPIQGAFVKMPEPGIYENIAVLDFRSLYPSIIISHNIDPSTLNCSCCHQSDAIVSPQGHRFCAKRKGLVPRVLSEVLETRFAVKKEMKKFAKQSEEYRQLDARQWALKVLANSFYGYLAYSRSRWYSRECGESTTAWARHYILQTIQKAEQEGFKVLYSDTDSIFLLFPKGAENAVIEFQKSVNSSLPEKMELELEDFYPRGIFVGKKTAKSAAKKALEKKAAKPAKPKEDKNGEFEAEAGKEPLSAIESAPIPPQEAGEPTPEGEVGAKKKYALINREGKVKIRGFELVRRDWSQVARDLQRRVLEILLKEGDEKKAVAEAKEAIANLRAGKIPLEKTAIWTTLQKKVSEYEVKSPEVSAVIKAREAGLKIPEGAAIQFVITKSGKTISEKAQLLELAKDYDAEYYVDNQVIPAVLKILAALGVDADFLKTGKTQSTLGNW